MDRIENVRRQRELARELLDWCEGGGSSVAIDYEAVAELAELVLALDASQPQAGFQPGGSSAVREIGLARDAEAAA